MFIKENVAELCDVRKKQGRFGLEIEVEGDQLPLDVIGWNITHDGSLRGDEAREFVLARPVGLAGIRVALDRLGAAYDECNSTIDETIRAGVHVHVNVTDINITQMMNFVTVYYIFEDFLCDFCGPERSGNHFCLRLKDAYAPAFFLKECFQNESLRFLATDNIRYAALNFASLFRHGSLEFRAMRSTADLGEVYKWVLILNELYENAVTNYHEFPSDIPRMFSGDGAEFFVKRFLPTYGKELVLDRPDYEKTLRDSLRNCQPFIYSTDWRR